MVFRHRTFLLVRRRRRARLRALQPVVRPPQFFQGHQPVALAHQRSRADQQAMEDANDALPRCFVERPRLERYDGNALPDTHDFGNTIYPIVAKYDVDLMMAGHSHAFENSARWPTVSRWSVARAVRPHIHFTGFFPAPNNSGRRTTPHGSRSKASNSRSRHSIPKARYSTGS